MAEQESFKTTETSVSDEPLPEMGVSETSCRSTGAEDSLVDRLVKMATGADGDNNDGDNDDDGDFHSASSGEDDDEVIKEWSESLPVDIHLTAEKRSSETLGNFSPSQNHSSQLNNSDIYTTGDSSSAEYNTSGFTTAESRENNERSQESTDQDSKSANHSEDNPSAGAEVERDVDDDKETNMEKEEEEEERKQKEEEDAMPESELQVRLAEAVKVKGEANTAFKNENFEEAFELYTKALKLCPLKYVQQRSVLLSNRAACYFHMEEYEIVVQECSKAIVLQPRYVRAISRRARAYEKLEKFQQALVDHKLILEVDPSQKESMFACKILEEKINVQNEKLKAEMMSKLKDLGNMVLRPFGLSTNNFQFQQDPVTGSYSIQMVQNPSTNGK